MVTDCTGANDSERGVTRKRPVSFWSFTYTSGFSSSAAELALKVIVHWQKKKQTQAHGAAHRATDVRRWQLSPLSRAGVGYA